jgi:hypothetical protein
MSDFLNKRFSDYLSRSKRGATRETFAAFYQTLTKESTYAEMIEDLAWDLVRMNQIMIWIPQKTEKTKIQAKKNDKGKPTSDRSKRRINGFKRSH